MNRKEITIFKYYCHLVFLTEIPLNWTSVFGFEIKLEMYVFAFEIKLEMYVFAFKIKLEM